MAHGHTTRRRTVPTADVRRTCRHEEHPGSQRGGGLNGLAITPPLPHHGALGLVAQRYPGTAVQCAEILREFGIEDEIRIGF